MKKTFGIRAVRYYQDCYNVQYRYSRFDFPWSWTTLKEWDRPINYFEYPSWKNKLFLSLRSAEEFCKKINDITDIDRHYQHERTLELRWKEKRKEYFKKNQLPLIKYFK